TAEEIGKNIDSINTVTQETASGIQQIAKAAEDLNRLTVSLQDLIGRFRVDSNSSQAHHGDDRYKVRANGKLIKG
ncbi:MAG: hypothetical protein C0442_11110, partial [Chlorobiaceae bacterium]|nr:hypothetical protein [Chlorobiaceae bacterium]